VGMAVSLDGFVATTDGGLDWIFPHMDAEIRSWIIGSVGQTDTQLLGRVNYLEQAAYWPESTEDLAPLVNSAAKVVFSATLTDLPWSNSRLATLDVAGEIAQLKAVPGQDILVPGGARFAQFVSSHGLADEYRLVVYPVALGSGLPLFTRPRTLRLVACKPFRTGAVALTYVPA
jgi:dihydrofolate reductase